MAFDADMPHVHRILGFWVRGLRFRASGSVWELGNLEDGPPADDWQAASQASSTAHALTWRVKAPRPKPSI